jgi:hypothetical protein
MAAQKAAGLMATGTQGQLRGRDVSGGVVINPPENEEPELRPLTLTEIGIDKSLAQRAREAAALPEEEFEDRIAEKRDNIVNRTSFSLALAISKIHRGWTGHFKKPFPEATIAE